MTAATLHIGDVFDVMATMPDGTIDLVLTSPPFLALRSYLPADHPDKGKEIGSEPTPAAFLDTMLALTAEWGRLLTPTGSIAIELGDTYAGSGGAGGDYGEGGLRQGQPAWRGSNERASVQGPGAAYSGGDGWPLPKSLCFIPQLYAASLAYGRNLLTGEDSPAGRWRVRNYICWARPNPPVGALGDKWRPATSYVTVATRSRTRYFDLDAVRTPGTEPGAVKRRAKDHSAANPHTGWSSDNTEIHQNPAGAPPLDWVDDREATWEPLIGMPTAPYPGAHYATFPSELPRRLIECMAPAEVCTTCSEPRRRIAVTTNAVGQAVARASHHAAATGHDRSRDALRMQDCGCGTGWRPGVVLDPFAGSGTTLAVAHGHARTAIGIDLNDDNEHLIRDRVGGLFLTVVNHKTGAAA